MFLIVSMMTVDSNQHPSVTAIQYITRPAAGHTVMLFLYHRDAHLGDGTSQSRRAAAIGGEADGRAGSRFSWAENGARAVCEGAPGFMLK